jgi:hypothetical protein
MLSFPLPRPSATVGQAQNDVPVLQHKAVDIQALLEWTDPRARPPPGSSLSYEHVFRILDG